MISKNKSPEWDEKMQQLATAIFACVIAIGFATLTAPEAEAKKKDTDYRFGQLSKDQSKAWKKQMKRDAKASKHRDKQLYKRQKQKRMRHHKNNSDALSRGLSQPDLQIIHQADNPGSQAGGRTRKKGFLNRLGNGFF